ncbi:MAG TPA: hypothetical protein DCX32_02535 [Candidatus Moranbacteria bacterium]|nr:hypothetical protein [Candidatus Moranbacteria bacterium]
MSKKRIILITVLVLLILATAAFFASSIMKKSNEAAKPLPTVEKIQPTQEPVGSAQPTEDALAPLPADNSAAIDSEITNIEMEINSAIETELDDLSGIEESL